MESDLPPGDVTIRVHYSLSPRDGAAIGTAGFTTVMPFILRGVALLGIDSVLIPIGPRRVLWEQLASSLRSPYLSDISHDVDVKDVVDIVDQVRAGKYSGRAVVRVAGGF